MKTLDLTSFTSRLPLQNALRLVKQAVIIFAQAFCFVFTALVICLFLDDGFIELVAQGISRNQLGESLRAVLHIVTLIATFLTALVATLTAGNWTGRYAKALE